MLVPSVVVRAGVGATGRLVVANAREELLVGEIVAPAELEVEIPGVDRPTEQLVDATPEQFLGITVEHRQERRELLTGLAVEIDRHGVTQRRRRVVDVVVEVVDSHGSSYHRDGFDCVGGDRGKWRRDATSNVPISIDAFENGSDPPRAETPHQIVTFLAAHPEFAYTAAEIAGTVGVDHETVETALDELADRELVRQAGDYWTVAEAERVAAAADLHTTTRRLDDTDGGIDTAAWDAVAPDEPHPSERDEEDAER